MDISMPKLFEAAKTGNLKELIKLKQTGVNFSQRDKDGNTPLLWAACYGHVHIVKWLLQESNHSHITEKNNVGNTALLLAVAYGRLPLVQWLLREGGSTLTEQNTFGSTPILLAVNDEQLLPIVDYLVRHYYLGTDFKLDVSPKNKATLYYFKIVEYFSQKQANYSELHALLDTASTKLNKNELAFLHFIYLWMDIAYQANRSNGCVRTTAKEPYIEQLLPSHQFELIAHMFQKGYVLNNRPDNRNTPNSTGIFLNSKQKKAIQELLKQSKHDNYLMSRNSEDEKNQLFNSYYLMPLYRSVIHTLQSKDKIDKVLRVPYIYHSRTVRNSLIDADVAKWTAYHLCQDTNTSLQQHVALYDQTIGVSRKGYYEIIEKCLNNNHPQKELLLLNLGNLTDFKGERLYWTKKYPSWLQKLGQGLSTHKSSEQTPKLRMIGISHTIPLKHEVCQLIWDSTKHQPKPPTLTGNHPVYKLNAQGVYCKLFPGLPGINDALQHLYRRLFGATGGLPWSVTGLLEIDNQTIPVLLSENAGEQIKTNDSRLQNLNLYALSKLLLFSILTNPEDGKRDNYTLKKNANGTYDIYSIDYDQGLVEATVESSSWFSPTKKLAIKSLLFCLDAMKNPLDPKAINELLAIDAMKTIQAWLSDLVKLDEEYKVLFKDCKDQLAQEKTPNRRSYVQMIAPMAKVLNIAHRLQELQTILRNDTQVSPLSLLQRFEPTAANYYQKYINEPLCATNRFDKLIKNEALYDWNEKTQSYSTSLTSSKELFESLVPNNLAEAVSPRIALRELEKITRKWEQINASQVRLLQGEIDHFKQLSLKDQQALLKLTQFNQLHLKKRELLLDNIAYRKDLTELYLHSPLDSLADWRLSCLLKNNKHLNKLSINNATAIKTLAPIGNVHTLTYLKLSQLPLIKEFTVKLPNVTDLILKDMAELNAVRLNAPKLQRLTIINCPNLQILNLPESSQLENVLINGSNKLSLADFYCRWPRFTSHWSNIPERLGQRIADCITQSIETTSLDIVLSQKIYLGVTDFLGGLTVLCLPLIEQLNTKHAFSAAYVLAHLGYDYPKVINTLFSEIKNGTIYSAREAAVRALCALKINDDRIIKPLLTLFNSDNTEQWLHANDIVKKLQLDDKRIIPHVFDGLNNSRTANSANKTLARLNVLNKELPKERMMSDIETRFSSNDILIHNLLDWLNWLDWLEWLNILEQQPKSKVAFNLEPDELALFNALRNEDITLRLNAMNTLKLLAKNNSETFKKLLSKAELNHCKEVLEAIYSLHQFRPGENCIIEALASILEDESRHLVREKALKISMNLQVKDGRIYSALLKILEDNKDGYLISKTIELLNVLYPKDENVSLILLNALNLKNKDIFRSAAGYLLKWGDERAISALLSLVEQTTDKEIISIGVKELVRYHLFDNEDSFKRNHSLFSALVTDIGHPLNYVRFAAKDIIALHIKDERLAQICLKALKIDNPYYNELSSAVPGCYDIEGILKTQFAAFFLENNKRTPLNDASTQSLSLPEKKKDNKSQADISNSRHLQNKENPLFLPVLSSEFLPQLKRDVIGYALFSLAANMHVPFFDQFFQHYYSNVPSNKIRSVFKHKDLSLLHLIYLSRLVSRRANMPSGRMEAINNAPSMSQLLPEHQNELILHMIREGYVLDNWSINTKELIITDMTFDEKQALALQQLLEQSEYDICLKTQNSVIKSNTIYFGINKQKALQFTVQDLSGTIRSGIVNNLDDKLTAPLTLDQLKSVPCLLNFMSSKGFVRPGLQVLTLNKVRFTKEYELRRTDADIVYKPNRLYVQTKENGVEYTVITPAGRKVSDIISCDDLKQMGVDFMLLKKTKPITDMLKPRRSDILKITTQRGHTVAESSTKGYKTFLDLLKNKLLMPNLQTLHLQDCDLNDDVDLPALDPILDQRTTLRQLNLDHNHMTHNGLLNLLDALKNSPTKLKVLSVSFNNIEIITSNALKFVASKSDSIDEINLTGNMIASNAREMKMNHKLRVIALSLLFLALSKKETNLTVNAFLFATDINLTREGEDDYLFEITLADSRTIKVNLNSREFCAFENLDSIKNKFERQEITFRRSTPKELFFYLISGINPDHIPQQLKDSLLSPTPRNRAETKETCRQLLNYHWDAKLKGQLIRHSLFRSQKMERQPSYLFPEAQLSIEKGWVYLIANKYNGFLGNEHAMLGYEYLTDYGQRIFKVAHLLNDPQIDKTFIEFRIMELPQLILWTKLGRIIARMPADTKCLKRMDESIQNQVNPGGLPDVTFQKVIFGSSRNKKIMNCLDYCLTKMNEYLGIPIILDNLDYRPSSVVANYIKHYPVTENVQLETSKGYSK